MANGRCSGAFVHTTFIRPYLNLNLNAYSCGTAWWTARLTPNSTNFYLTRKYIVTSKIVEVPIHKFLRRRWCIGWWFLQAYISITHRARSSWTDGHKFATSFQALTKRLVLAQQLATTTSYSVIWQIPFCWARFRVSSKFLLGTSSN